MISVWPAALLFRICRIYLSITEPYMSWLYADLGFEGKVISFNNEDATLKVSWSAVM